MTEQKMNPEYKTKWLDALRSGEYGQGTGALRTKDDTYCCLGVLADICVKEGLASWVESDSDPEEFAYVVSLPEGREDGAYLPAKIADHVGVDRLGRRGTGLQTLANLNDDSGHTFEQIADIIEEEF